MKLGEYIKTFRENHNISMEKFADMSGLSKSYVGVLERGKNYKTGEPITPSVSIIKKVADATGVSFDALFSMIDGMVSVNSPKATQEAVKIPILGTVVAGMPISAYEDILGYEEITPEMAETGEFYALRVRGDSMTPRICEGDVVIVKVQPDVECGERTNRNRRIKRLRSVLFCVFRYHLNRPLIYPSERIRPNSQERPVSNVPVFKPHRGLVTPNFHAPYGKLIIMFCLYPIILTNLAGLRYLYRLLISSHPLRCCSARRIIGIP